MNNSITNEKGKSKENWRWILRIGGIIGLIVSICVFFFFPDPYVKMVMILPAFVSVLAIHFSIDYHLASSDR